MTNGPLPEGRLLWRWTFFGAAFAGLAGAIGGLIVGLLVYPPTAWFAVFELGLPASILGGLIGAGSGAVVCAVRRVTPKHPDP
jgi:hypothetical protein